MKKFILFILPDSYRDGPGSICEVDVYTPVYYNIQGIRAQQPADKGIYIVKKIHASQKIEVSKVLYKK